MGAALTWVRYKVCAQRGLGDRALDRSAGGSGMVVAVRVCVYGSPRDLRRGSPWGRMWRMEERGELVRRAGEGGMHSTVVLAGGGEGDVTDAGAAAAPVPSELSEWSPRPARCSHVLQGHPPLG